MEILIHSSFNLDDISTEKRDKVLVQLSPQEARHRWENLLRSKVQAHGQVNEVQIELSMDDKDVYNLITVKLLVNIFQKKNTKALREKIHKAVKEALLAGIPVPVHSFSETLKDKDFD